MISKKTFYKTYANKLTRVRNLSKKLYYKEAICLKKKTIPRSCGSLLILLSRQNPPSPKTLNNHTVIEDPFLISELFNDYFVKIGQSIANKTTNLLNLDFNLYLKNRVFTIIVLSFRQPDELFNIINSLNPNKALWL